KAGGDSRRRNPEFPSDLSPKAQHLQDILGGIASKIGGDHTKDLSRLLRVPGLLNRKDERNGRPPVPCELVECDRGRRYPLADFEGFAAHSPEKAMREAVAKVKLPRPRADLTANRARRLEDLVSACRDAEDRSGADWHLCCWAIERGVGKEVVW